MIMNAVDLALARLARGGGDGKVQVFTIPEKLSEHRALAHSGRTGDNKSFSLCHSSLHAAAAVKATAATE